MTDEEDELITTKQVSAMFRVDSKTVTRWARSGKLSAIRTVGGHRRYRLSEVNAAIAATEEHASNPPAGLG